jgi:hypothetical protein
MCEPGTLALLATSAALSAGGALAQANAQRQSAKAVNSAQEQNARDRIAATMAGRDARTDELGRQDATRDTNRMLLGDTIAGQAEAPREERLDAQVARREGLYDRAGVSDIPFAPSSTAGVTGANAGPTVVGDNLGSALAKAGDFIRQQRASKAALEGWGDFNFGNNIGLARSGEGIAIGNNFRRGSNQAFNFERHAIADKLGGDNDTMQARIAEAPSKGAGMRTAGNVLTMLGDLGGKAAGAGLGDAIYDKLYPSSGLDWLGNPSGISTRALNNPLPWGGPR